MKQIFILSIVLLSVFFCQAQQNVPGNLVADTINASTDTLKYAKIVHLDGMNIKCDSGYAIRKIAPMIFSANGVNAKTDQQTTLKIDFYVLPGRKKIESDDILFLKLKPL